MWIKHIEVENFGCFNGRRSYVFGPADPKMFTMFSGIDGSGKSTLVTALWWLFHGPDGAPNSLNLRTPLNIEASERGLTRYSIRASIETTNGSTEVDSSLADDATNQIKVIDAPMFVTDEVLEKLRSVQDASVSVATSYLRALESIVMRPSTIAVPVPVILDDCIGRFDDLTLRSCWNLLNAYKGQVIVTTTYALEHLRLSKIPASVVYTL